MRANAKPVLWALVGTFAADVLSKWLVQRYFFMGESVHLAPGLALTYVRNPGAAFSMFATWPASIRLPLFFGVTLAALGAAWFYWKSLPVEDRLSALALGLVVGGALGNLADRIRLGEVVDFIEAGPPGFWPIFNVADSAVCIGVGFLIYRSLKPLKEESVDASHLI